MALLSVQNVSVSFGERDVLRNISFDIAKGDRVGLIGSNGCGKTTLFNAITGKLEVTEGAVVRASGTVIGCVEQHACADSARTVYDELLTVFAFLEQTEKELEEIHRKVELTDGSVPEYIEKQSELTEFYQANGGLTYRARAHSCLKGLGFSPAEEELPVSALSGGQRTKLSLGKLLLSEPDLMLLDEPTNHLDTVSVEWLEDFLSKFGGSLMVISHDRYFLDKVTTRTMEITVGRLYAGKGAYTEYMKLKAQRLESDRREYEKGMLEIKRIEKMIDQQKTFSMERNYITIASKEKQIERIRASLPELPPKERTYKLRFTDVSRSGDDVLFVEKLKKSYGGNTLFENVNFRMTRGERVFLIGPNGCGKSTMLSILMRKTVPDEGLCRFGVGVKLGFFEQTQRELMSDKTVLYEIYDRFPTLSIPEIRGYLGAFMFRNDETDKRMRDLSGGERARVALLILILKKPNFLILDEPTNHLDVASREVLEEALSEFEGTLLCVSHDRYFVNRLATRILSFDGTSVNTLDGNYDDYVNAVKNRPQAGNAQTHAEKKPNEYVLRREREREERKRASRVKKIESLLDELNARAEELTERLQSPEVASDYEKITEITSQLDEVNTEKETLENEWLELNE